MVSASFYCHTLFCKMMFYVDTSKDYTLCVAMMKQEHCHQLSKLHIVQTEEVGRENIPINAKTV